MREGPRAVKGRHQGLNQIKGQEANDGPWVACIGRIEEQPYVCDERQGQPESRMGPSQGKAW